MLCLDWPLDHDIKLRMYATLVLAGKPQDVGYGYKQITRQLTSFIRFSNATLKALHVSQACSSAAFFNDCLPYLVEI